MSAGWIWSGVHRNHYYVTYDVNGQPIYHWAQQSQQLEYPAPVPDQPQSGSGADRAMGNHIRADSGYSVYSGYSQTQYSNYDSNPAPVPEYPEPVSAEIRSRLPNLIPGTPQNGWYERLDSSYRMRTGPEARQFFRVGRVFSMLHSEAASETMARAGSEDDAVTVVKYGERVYSQIRRFVIVSVKRHFVYACAISTYSGRATLKRGCDPSEHAAVYLYGGSPAYFPGEVEKGMTKEPIAIDPANSDIAIDPASRLRFGKTYPIEWNVKVKDIGTVVSTDQPKLIMYWEDG